MTTTLGENHDRPKYRLLVICNDSDYFFRHRLYLVSYLVTVGVDVMVIAGGPSISQERTKGWEYLHVPVERFRFDPFSDIALTLHTGRAIWLFKPDAVHLITLKPAIFSGFASAVSRFFRRYPRRILITLPGLGRMMSPIRRRGERSYPIGNALTLLAMRLLSKLDRVHFSFETRNDCNFWVDKGIASGTNSSIINGAGVDPNLFYPIEPARSGSRINVIFASRLLKSKGLEAFLATASELADRSDVQFIVAGVVDDQDPDAVPPEDLARMTEICFLGMVEDMPPLLRECDIVCLPTRYGEGIPRILIEAAATGLASIVSDHPGCHEIVEDGVTGRILSATSDIEMSRKLSAAIVDYLDNPDRLKQHKQAAYQHFQSRGFSQQACIARFVELLGVPLKSP